MATVSNINASAAGSRGHLRTMQRRFQGINQERLARLADALSREQRLFLDVLPLLLHLNHPDLPGFTSKKAPAGVADYQPGRRSLEAAAKLVRKFSYRRRALRVYNILGLYMMGSSASIAYSKRSDFDFWLCHRSDLNDAQLEALKQKTDAITAWARSLRLDVTFFLMDVEAFRRGETSSLSEDSSGSAQHHLLLEEFYRTALLLCGRYPAWWLVPPDQEHNYRGHLNGLVQRRLIDPMEYVDFGGIPMVPPDEFIGAALWQLHKAVNSPYKSVLKLLLLEAYAAELPHADLLCTRYKQAIYSGEINIEKLDPYVQMAIKVTEYLQQRGEHDRIELARKCLYFKVNEKLSKPTPRNPSYQREMLAELVETWGWTRDNLLVLDQRSEWKIQRVLNERSALVAELTRSYRTLSEFARSNATGSRISNDDLNLLGRRLYAAFERKAGKVEFINPGISADLTEERLCFSPITATNKEGWTLQRASRNLLDTDRELLKRSHSLIELIAWCHFNGLIGPQTIINLENAGDLLSNRELVSVIDSFRHLFPDPSHAKPSMGALNAPSGISQGALFINLGVDPFHEHTRQGVHLTSARSDALSYGGFWKNLAMTFDMVVLTTWKEILTFRYSGATALLDFICEFFAWAPISAKQPPPQIPVFSFSTTRGMAIAHRIEQLMRDIAQVFYRPKQNVSPRYVLLIEHDYFVLQTENDMLRFARAASEAELIKILGQAQDRFSPVVFDRFAVQNCTLAALTELNRPGSLQFFFKVDGKQADIFIIDELGSVFHQRVSYYSAPCLLSQYGAFLNAVIDRCNMAKPGGAHAIAKQVDVYQLQVQRSGQVAAQQVAADLASLRADYLSIQVIGTSNDSGTTQFSLFLNGREFSTLEFGDEVFGEVAKHVVQQRRGGERYPIYITDIDADRSLLGAETAEQIQTAHYLRLKKNIEKQLNDALRAL